MHANYPLQIVIDGRMVSNTGIGRWLQNTVAALRAIDSQHQIKVLINPDSERLRSFSGPTQLIRIPAPIYSIREQLSLPIELAASGADLVHYPNFNIPVFDKTRCVVTLSDIIYYRFPRACPSWHAHQYARFMIRHAARKARRVITVSEYSKRDIVEYAGVPAEKVDVIYDGIDTTTFHPGCCEDSLRTFLRTFNIRKPYILYTGNHEPRKNLVRMVRAYRMLSLRKDFQLVIGGRIDERRHGLYRELFDLRECQDVILCGEIDEAKLPAIYAGAALFVFPSLYEGFGLPPLEAMASGTPVACSSATSLPEVVGNAARMFVPTEVEDIAAAMQDVLTKPDLARDLRRKGLERAQRFSWSKAAEQTMRLYEAAAAS